MNHPEAFMLMNYASDDGSRNETIWNSRDGVTPFCIGAKDGIEMRHVDWDKDRFAPDHKPQPGDRIFIDATADLIGKSLDRYIEKYWDMGQSPMKQMWDTKEQAKETLLESWLKPGSPCLVTVQADGAFKHEGDD